MKFGKEYVSQMVPEWQQAYMDFAFLKTLLKEIQDFRQRNGPPPPSTGLHRRPTLYRAFSGLIRNNSAAVNRTTTAVDMENQVILVNGDKHETMFLRTTDEGGEYEMVYFRRLDDEFRKVVKFYQSKVEEVVTEAQMLNKQMDALIAFRIKVDKPQGWIDSSGELTRLASDVALSTAKVLETTPSSIRGSRRVPMNVIDEEESRSSEQSDESGRGEDIREETIVKFERVALKLPAIKTSRPTPIELLDRVKINNTKETPRSTIKGLLNDPTNSELNFNRENLKRVEEQLKKAFVEFYNKLRLLKSFSFLNTLAFSKIMKKYDKITSRNASKDYLKMVDDSFLGSSDEVSKLLERVEIAFVKHFAKSNRSSGMSILRPKAKKERHRITFFLGFFAGCTVALILALILIMRARKILDHRGKEQYMENMFPLYILFAFVVLHMIMYAANIFFWRRYRVNYSFIFGFKQGTELGYREVLLLSLGLAVLALASVLSNLDLEMDPDTKDFKAITELVPLGLVVFVLLVMFCPFNIIYRSSRFFFLTCVFHCICAPLYKVTLPDFFLADQLTSQVQAIRSLQFYVCYYGWGDFKRRENTCTESDVYRTFYFILAVIPYWSRLLQCLRRLAEERDMMQGVNGLKYLSTIIAVCMRTAHTYDKGIVWKLIAWISSANAALFGIYWDLVIDWGLFQKHSKNYLLRDKLLIPQKSVYFVAIVLNVLLRFAWLQSVLNFSIPFLHRQGVIAIVALLEILRRGIWNFFRLENEHLNNVGKYRAFKSVPLPFNYDEEDKKDW